MGVKRNWLVVGHFDRAGFRAELQDRCVAKRELRPVEGVEILEDQQRHRLTQIERRLAHRAHEVAGIEFGNAHPGSREVGGGHHHGRLQRTAQARKVEAFVKHASRPLLEGTWHAMFSRANRGDRRHENPMRRAWLP